MKKTLQSISCVTIMGFILTLLVTSNVHARREVLPDTVAVQPGNGQHASNVAVFGGTGSILLTIMSAIVTVGEANEDATGIFAIGIIVGIASVISGIIGLVNRKNWTKSGKPFKNKFQRDAIRNKSVLGIVLGLLSTGVSIILILIKSGVMGFA